RGLSNLVQNALAHAEKVEIRLVDGPKAVDILVDDDGPGIPEDKRDAAFKPFVKFTDETAPIRNSFGLGLALARDGARSHGGDVTLETSPLGGLRARLRLPH
ncbi:MAG: ATP-binding protein, partial [Pseudomonadota bacterium]